MSTYRAAIAGCVATAAARPVIRALLWVRLRRDLQALNVGDYRPLLANYTDDAVLRFPDGDHRWAGEHRGKPAIERFLREFTAAGLRGNVRELVISGPPWRMMVIARFDDYATGPDGQPLYGNRAVLLIRTRWGRIVEQSDFFEDTGRITNFETRLRALGITPVS